MKKLAHKSVWAERVLCGKFQTKRSNDFASPAQLGLVCCAQCYVFALEQDADRTGLGMVAQG